MPAEPVEMRPPPAGAGPRSERFLFVDALRGIAALAVAWHHIDRYGPLRDPATPIIPEWCRTLAENGWIGVQMFFVISGFVIAYSVRKAAITPRFVGNFALRRSLRLDPPYWCMILVALVLHNLTLQFGMASPLDDPPTRGQLVAHVFYLQNILDFENLSAGFWTLCIEIQFYLLFVALLGLAQRLPWAQAPAGTLRHGLNLAVVFLPLALASLFVFHLDASNDDWIIHFFCMFCLGAMAWWALEGKIPRAHFWIFAGLIAVRLGMSWTMDLAIALAAGVAIYVAGRRGKLGTWLNLRPLQYLGRISYSLYLIHYPVSHLVVNLGYKLTGEAPVAAAFWIVLSLPLSVLAGHVMYRFIEVPSVRLAARLKPYSGAGPVSSDEDSRRPAPSVA